MTGRYFSLNKKRLPLDYAGESTEVFEGRARG